jgi:hypothetical protein
VYISTHIYTHTQNYIYSGRVYTCYLCLENTLSTNPTTPSTHHMWGNTATLHRPGVPVMVVVALLLLATFPSTKAFASPRIARCWTCTHWVPVPLPLRSTNNDDDNNNNPESSSAPPPRPRTFREAEMLGLQWMQEGNYGDALDGTYHQKDRPFPFYQTRSDTITSVDECLRHRLGTHSRLFCIVTMCSLSKRFETSGE